jgi:hypothetical protein
MVRGASKGGRAKGGLQLPAPGGLKVPAFVRTVPYAFGRIDPLADGERRWPTKGGGDSVMSAQFWPCPGCSRHVKRGDALCPFCGATASVQNRPSRTIAGRLSRAALFAAGAVGTAVATTDCSTSPLQPLAPDAMASAGSSNGASAGAQALYGGPIPTETEDSSASAGSINGASAGSLYGGPFPPFAIETEDSSASDGPSEVAADATDASATTMPTDSSIGADVPMLFEAAYGSPVIDDATTVTPAYGGAVAPDE